MKMFEVGGCVRDEILGVPSKDIDFTVVISDYDYFAGAPDNPFDLMVEKLKDMGFKIFLETPEFLTVRAQFPGTGYLSSKPERGGMTADFVLARKEGDYTDGRRPNEVIPGTLEDDLARRDFTMNAIAKSAGGSYIDPFNGRDDIAAGIIRAVGDPIERLSEDALRAVRALRFSVTKGFSIEPGLVFAMEVVSILDKIAGKAVSDDRIREELEKMFRFDTVKSLRALERFPRLTEAMFSGSVSLNATQKQRGRG